MGWEPAAVTSKDKRSHTDLECVAMKKVMKCSSFSENQLRGNERGTGRIRVRVKAALSPRDDNGVLYSVTKEGCGLGHPSSSHF